LKSGGAWRTKRAGRPWAYACVVHGFANQTSALQFEWAWQNCDKSIAVRNALGDQQARKLKNKRGVYGKLHILKALVTECKDLCESQQTLSISFFDILTKLSFDNLKLESDLDLPVSVTCVLIQSVEEMAFWKKRELKRKKSSNAKLYQGECMLCSKKITNCDQITKCHKCSRLVHERCNDIHAEEGDGLCPHCDTFLDCDISFDSASLSSEASPMSVLKPDKASNINDDESSLDSFDNLIPSEMRKSFFFVPSLHREGIMDDSSDDVTIESLLHFKVIEYSNSPVMSFDDESVQSDMLRDIDIIDLSSP
jgi:hypothetical protein